VTHNELKESLARIEKEFEGVGLMIKLKDQTREMIMLDYLDRRQLLILQYLESEANRKDGNKDAT
jgi:hypothetical protein